MSDLPKPHPLANLLPRMMREEYIRLCDSIREEGLLDPIALYEGKVLDGRHRLRACVEVGVEPRFVEYEGETPAAFALARNVIRRHLAGPQRAMLATTFLPALADEAAKRKREGGERGGEVQAGRAVRQVTQRPPRRASEDAAELVGVSPATVERAKRVADADPELARLVQSGRLPINTALQRTVLLEHVRGDHEAEEEIREGRRAEEVLADAAERGSEKAGSALVDLRHKAGIQHLTKACSELEAAGRSLPSLHKRVTVIHAQVRECIAEVET